MVLYVTASVSQLHSSLPESLLQRLPGYWRVKVSYCVTVATDVHVPIFIQLAVNARIMHVFCFLLFGACMLPVCALFRSVDKS